MNPIRAPASLVVARARAGDPAALRQLYEQHFDAVFGYCLAFCRGDREQARDLSQEAFTRAFASLPELRDPAAFPKWLKTTTRRCCLRWIERKEREREALRQLADEKQRRFRRSLLGRWREAIVETETETPDLVQATTDNYATVMVPARWPAGSLIRCRPDHEQNEKLYAAEAVPESDANA